MRSSSPRHPFMHTSATLFIAPGAAIGCCLASAIAAPGAGTAQDVARRRIEAEDRRADA